MHTDKPVFTIICVFNDSKILENFLLKGLETQNCPHETILIDNSGDAFPSAAKAFNSVLDKAKGEYVVFSHQDISLNSTDALESIDSCLRDLGNPVIVGAAGKQEGSEYTTSCIVHGNPPRRAGRWRTGAKTERVQTVDECFFIVSGRLLQRHAFDEVACSGWHLYAVDYCLSLKGQAGVFVIPMKSLYHKSTGLISGDYYSTLKNIAGKYEDRLKWINTTCGNWPTDSGDLDKMIADRIDSEIGKARRRERRRFYVSMISGLLGRGDSRSFSSGGKR